jgi:hypothetical protein
MHAPRKTRESPYSIHTWIFQVQIPSIVSVLIIIILRFLKIAFMAIVADGVLSLGSSK